MGYYEDNVLYEDSFSKAICSIESLTKPDADEEFSSPEEHSLPISPFGMFEMANKFDIVKSKLADDLFNELGPSDGKKFKRFREKMQLLRERNMFELEKVGEAE
jgi:hypothetical protein